MNGTILIIKSEFWFKEHFFIPISNIHENPWSDLAVLCLVNLYVLYY